MLMSLKAVRVNKGLTQREAAKLLNVGIEKLRRWEQSITQPRAAEIKRIEQVYEINFSDIFFGN